MVVFCRPAFAALASILSKKAKPMWGYRKRLTSDLARWTESGWVSREGAARILDDVATRKGGVGLATALGILASVLLGFAVISFVAAHWEEIPRTARLGLLGALIAGGYALSGWLTARQAHGFSDAAILFSCAMFGAAIMLISQMFHIEGRPAEGVALWAAGTAFAGVVLRSNAALAFALVLASVWSGMEIVERNQWEPHWPFLGAWALLALAFAWQRWRPGLHLAGLSLSAFVILLGYQLNYGHAHELVAALGAGVAIAAAALPRFRPDWEGLSAPVLGYALATAYAGLFTLQFLETPSNAALIVLAAASLVLLLGAIGYGLFMHQPGALWIGYIGFSIEILALYWKTVGSILGTSVFFLAAGLLVAALAYAAWRLASRAEGAPA